MFVTMLVSILASSVSMFLPASQRISNPMSSNCSGTSIEEI